MAWSSRAVDEKYVYRLSCEGPTLYFFERDFPAFEAMVKSLERYANLDMAVKAPEAGTALRSPPRWAAARLDALEQKKKYGQSVRP